MITYGDFGINVPPNKTTGEYSTTCPKCSNDRTKKNAKCLGVNLDKQVWHCNHCDWRGGLPTRNNAIIPEKPYVRPKWNNNTALSDNVVKWFEGRGIRQEVLKEMQITQGKEWMPQTGKEEHTIQFNYFRNGELVNVKYRTGGKHFKMVKDAEMIVYNIDSLKGQKKAYIVEGEMDCLAFIQAGIKNVVSVPNGATLGKINTDYLNNCINDFDLLSEIIIATDNDEAGRNLQRQLAERIGYERCKWVDFGSYKDMNEVLMAEGIQGVIATANNAKDFPIIGSFKVVDYKYEIGDIYLHGLPKGQKMGMERVDVHLSFHLGYLTVITGTPGSGKSDFLDQIILRLKWKCMFYSPENRPTPLHIIKLSRKLTAKPIWGEGKMSLEELDMAAQYLNQHVFFFEPDENYTLDTILDAAKAHKRKYGIDCYVIDAWNKLDHLYEGSETAYISKALDKITIFNQQNGLHCFLVAHPQKMQKEKDGTIQVPGMYDISGSAHFYNKADIGITVHRDRGNEKNILRINKVKFNHWGEVGEVELGYDKGSGRFFETGSGADMRPWINLNSQTNIIDEIYEGNDTPY